MKVLRREGTSHSVCMVLLTFSSQAKADNFLSDFNGVPFSSLEPEILCRYGICWLLYLLVLDLCGMILV